MPSQESTHGLVGTVKDLRALTVQKPTAISAPCDEKYTAAHDSGPRDPKVIRFIVWHSTQSPANTAEAVARYFATPGAGGSSNLVVDDGHCFRCVLDREIPWGAPPLNTTGFHIEACGFSSWSRATWFMHPKTLRRIAYKTAHRSGLYNVPLRFLTADDLKRIGATPKAGGGGVTTHAEISKAFRQSDHTDPGSGFPVSLVLRIARNYSKGMQT